MFICEKNTFQIPCYAILRMGNVIYEQLFPISYTRVIGVR
ncbi:hypothetical protein ymoll0001_25770 [Yersinia mollaretii ATCC 43969]|uniref:Uncharacterized protein n=1 Tax=Yersinia mollaretii (strain ATCC 43969 / DSM 18520 / CIP 103324 / CNY 7263 / WAIP 204) TaxID=349967 RepID=A0ABP2ENJ5_YERMW|nr:hypothetical protein ymoll0001_25770 [Yersinia mollaretii ATCC 43969]